MCKLPSTDKSSRAQRPSCILSSWWITSSITSWAGRALPLRTVWVTPLTATAREAAASPWAGSTWCKSWTSWGPCTSIQSRSKEATVTLVPWSRGSGPLVTLTNSKPNHALFTAFSSARGRWNYNENGRKLPPPLPVKFHRLRALSTSREERTLIIAEPLENSFQTKLESPKNCFTKEAWLLTVGRDITCLKLRYDILLVIFFVCSLLGWGPLSLSPCPPAQHSEI